MHQNETLRAASRLLATVEAGQAAALALAATYLSVRSAAAIREHLHEPMLDHSYLPDAVFERRLSLERVRRGIAPVSLAFERSSSGATLPPSRGFAASQPPARMPRPGLGARHGPAGNAGQLTEDARNDSMTGAQVGAERRGDERIARRIALGQGSGPELRPAAAPAEATAIALLVVPADLLSPEPTEGSGTPAAPPTESTAPATESAAPATEPAAPPESSPSPTPAATLRSLAATLGGASSSTPQRRSVPGPTPTLALGSPRAISLPPTGVVHAPAREEGPLDGPYITRETRHTQDSGGRPPAAVDLRALARAANQSAGGDEPLALDGQDDLNEDTSDNDSSEGMRVHFEVATPKAPAHVGNRLSFENDDLTVVHGDDREPANPSPRPEVLDRIEHQKSEEFVLLQFLDAARAHTERGDYLKAIQAYTDALDVRLSHSEAYIGRGRCQMELGDYTSAMSDFRRAEDLQPRDPESQAAMGDLYFARKEYKRAIEFYDEAVERDVAHAMARCRRGISHYYRKNYRQAFQDLQRANTLDPEIPNIKKYVQMALKKMDRGE